jgi:general secretion pathway protein A
MYLEFYGLRELPFNITPDPRFLYFSEHHRAAYDSLMFGISNRRGFIELTGEVGCGKTTLCRAVLANLGDDVETAFILNPSLSETQLIRAILNDFGLVPHGRDRLSYIETLNEFLLERAARGINVALLIDEAQNLSTDVMEQVRLLSNLETDQHKLLQIVLCGQPELRQRLARPDLRQLRQRITIRYSLPALTELETTRYISHRLHVAGGSNESISFAERAIHAVHRYAHGCPRLINAVCDHALLVSFTERNHRIDARHIRQAIQQLEG